jgi:hypothetical protein
MDPVVEFAYFSVWLYSANRMIKHELAWEGVAILGSLVYLVMYIYIVVHEEAVRVLWCGMCVSVSSCRQLFKVFIQSYLEHFECPDIVIFPFYLNA